MQSFDDLWGNEPEASSADVDPAVMDECAAADAAQADAAEVEAVGDSDETIAAADETPGQADETETPAGETTEAEAETEEVAASDDAVATATDPPAPVADARSEAEKHFEERREAATQYYVECSINRAKLEAALKMAKKREKDALDELEDIIDRGIEPTPLFDKVQNSPTAGGGARQEATDVAPDAGHRPILPPGCTSTTTPAGIAIHDPECNGTAPPTHEPDAWKRASVEELGLKPALQEKLIEAGITTIGKLEAFRAEVGDRRAEWPKGIGEAKITQIEDAVVDWLTKNRDSHLFGQEGSEAVSPAATFPTEAEWAEMSEDDQTAWLNERAVQLDCDNTDDLANRVAEGCDDFFTDGCEASEAGDLIANCEHPPGVECDAWILGWLWQGKQETEGEE